MTTNTRPRHQMSLEQEHECVIKILNLIDEKKAESIICYDVNGQLSYTDYIIIATTLSNTHANTMADYVAEMTKKEFSVSPISMDGYQVSNWICIDFGFIILHLMCQDERDYFNLELMWNHFKKFNEKE